ncbi:hypothetical protein BGX33_002494 [Mortierella sp. NVP41]|nr:hypothetical protein BGX33_002494 [Mortierella sp. NVP41]
MSLPVQNLKDLNLSSIKNIIFDLGNVLLRVNQDGTRQAFEALGARRPSAFQNMSNVVNNFQKGGMPAHDFRKTIRSTIGLPANVPDIEFDRAWSAPVLDFPRGRLGLVRAARKVYEYNVYLLSNADAILIERVNEIVHEGHTEDSLLPFFDRVFYSHETGHLKPDEQSFQQILREQNLVPVTCAKQALDLPTESEDPYPEVEGEVQEDGQALSDGGDVCEVDSERDDAISSSCSSESDIDEAEEEKDEDSQVQALDDEQEEDNQMEEGEEEEGEEEEEEEEEELQLLPTRARYFLRCAGKAQA